MKTKIIVLLLLFSIGCFNDNSLKDVGDIPFDESLDSKDFKVCNERKIKQYYVRTSSDNPPNYKGEKRALEKFILDNYECPKIDSANGYLTIRFIVNCNGISGRFRVEEMNFDYKPIKFDKKISNQLVEIVRNLQGWIPRKSKGENLDFYQYLTFKIKNGQIVKILP